MGEEVEEKGQEKILKKNRILEHYLIQFKYNY